MGGAKMTKNVIITLMLGISLLLPPIAIIPKAHAGVEVDIAGLKIKGRKTICIQNASTSVVYIGGSAVTADENSTGGFQLRAEGDSITIDVTDGVVVYGRVAGGTANVVVLEVS
jgi:hypothetical protein